MCSKDNVGNLSLVTGFLLNAAVHIKAVTVSERQPLKPIKQTQMKQIGGNKLLFVL